MADSGVNAVDRGESVPGRLVEVIRGDCTQSRSGVNMIGKA